jgi:very-short-patch-repair endonuclease
VTSELDPMHPFTTAQAVAAGIPASRLRSSAYRQLAKGKYVSARRRVDALLEAEAALLGHPKDAFVCHLTAARLYRMPVPHDVHAHVAVPEPGQRRRRTGVRSHVAAPGTRVVVYRGVRVASPVDVFVQLAETLPLVEMVVQGDHLVRHHACTPEELVAACRASKEDHAGRALAAARYVRRGVDSPMETRLRMLLVLAGLPEPTVNHQLRHPDGSVRRRFDLSYPHLRLIVEYDGRQHADDPAQHDHDLERREELDRERWRILVVTAKGIYQEPERTVRRVRDALVEQGAGRPRLRTTWRQHFPGRPAAS